MPGPGGPATEFPSCGTPPYSIGVKVYPPRRAVKRTRASITAAWPCRGRCVSRSILDSISASEGKQVKGNASGFGRRSLLAGMTGAAALSGAAPAATANRIVDENRQSGTTDWQLQHYRLDSGAGSGLRSPMLEGYVSDVSAYPGEPIDLLVSTSPPAKFTVEIYRTGYYGGRGGRLMTKLGPFSGEEQPVPLMGMERVRECAWKPAARLAIPAEWPSGVYLGKLSLVDQPVQSYVIFVVKQHRPADLLFQVSDFTW